MSNSVKFGLGNSKDNREFKCNTKEGIVKIKIKKILEVEFIKGKKRSKQVKTKNVSYKHGWCLITDYYGDSYVLDIRHVDIDSNIIDIKTEDEYFIELASGSNRIYSMFNTDLSFFKSIWPKDREYNDNDIIEIYKNKYYIKSPYSVSMDFGNKMHRLGIFKIENEIDLVDIICKITDIYLTERYINENISAYDGETRERLIDICRIKIEDKIPNNIDINKAFDLFANDKTLCIKTSNDKYFLKKYED